MKMSNMKITNHISLITISITCLLFADSAFAAFDLARAAKAVFDPINKVIDAHYSKGIFASGLIGAALTPGGDLRSKAIGMGMGCLLAGLSVAAVKSGFGI